MEYFVIYKNYDTDWYRTSSVIICVVTDEEVAKDFCNKYNCDYYTETIGKETLECYAKNLVSEIGKDVSEVKNKIDSIKETFKKF